MVEISIPELGYFTKCEATKLAKTLNGKAYLHFEVSYGGTAGNYVLNVGTEEDTDPNDLKWMFIGYAFSVLAERR